MSNTTPILGTNYDLGSEPDVLKLMDLIDKCKARGASGDLCLIAYAILPMAVAGRKMVEFSVAREQAQDVVIDLGVYDDS